MRLVYIEYSQFRLAFSNVLNYHSVEIEASLNEATTTCMIMPPNNVKNVKYGDREYVESLL